VEGLREAALARETDVLLGSPILPEEILNGILTLIYFRAPS